MILRHIIENIGIEETFGNLDREISLVTCDSRKCEKNSLFIAVRGFDNDGHEFIGQAIGKGAAVIVYQDEKAAAKRDDNDVTWIKVRDSRKSEALIADNFYDHPSSKLQLVGITGTNGKTTIATLLYRLFRSLGFGCGLLSTIANYVEDEKFPTINTTQDPITTNFLLNRMVEKGCQYCFMEVSSHSLHQDRVAGLVFRGAIFTNLTHDHLDYHKTYSEYIRCKKLLFDSLSEEAFALVNIDDRNGMIMVQNTAAKVYRYSMSTAADFKVKVMERSLEGSLLEINGKEVWTGFIGDHNAHNIIAVYGAAILLGGDSDEVLKGISALTPVAGRLEYFKGGKNVTAVVDYAHTPDALENVLKTLTPLGKVIAVFGCGGNRDKTKRPEMAEIGAKYADKVIITSDNPRFEEPEDIIKDMKAGLDNNGLSKTLFIVDRKEAIRTALSMAPEGSIVLVAGKGHEDYQIVKGVKSHFDDKEIIKEFYALSSI